LIDDAVKAGEFYAGLEQFTNDAGDGAQYDISGDMEDIFQVIFHAYLIATATATGATAATANATNPATTAATSATASSSACRLYCGLLQFTSLADGITHWRQQQQLYRSAATDHGGCR